MYKRIFISVFICAWFGFSIYMLWRTESGSRFKADEVPIVTYGILESESYKSLYISGEKVGYSSNVKQKIPTGLMLRETSYLRLPVGGAIQEVNSEMLLSTDNSLKIKNFSFEMSSEEYRSTVEGFISDGKLTLKIQTPENSSDRVIPLDGDIYLPSAITFLAAQDSFKEKYYTIPSFDPMTLTMKDYTVQVIRKGSSPRGDPNVWHLRAEYSGYFSEMWVDSLGDIVMEKMGSGFTAYRETKEKALSFELRKSGSFDLLTQFAIKTEIPSGIEFETAKVVQYKLDGFDKALFDFNDFNQYYDSESSILYVKSDGFTAHPELSPKVEPSDTAETPFIQKNDLRILRKAQEIAGKQQNKLEILKDINYWLFDNLEKDYKSSIPSALDVLDQMVGDCNEHASLFVALARSLGIPSRMNIGVVYIDGSFAYHAWPQSYVDGKWYTFEPTHGDFPANALHIRLLHGELEKQIEIVRLENPTIKIISIDDEAINTMSNSIGSAEKIADNKNIQ